MRAFSDREIIKMASEDYIPVTGDDWYERRRNDEAGKFWLSVAQQGPMKDIPTKQGIYMLTASGKLLASRNAGQDPKAMRDALRQGLAAWKKLPEFERQPGAFKVPELTTVDKNFVRVPPKDGLILTVFQRTLDKNPAAECGYCSSCRDMKAGRPIELEAQRDHLWLTNAEWKSLIPKDPKAGDSFAVPAGIAKRIFRFHLVDGVRGQPPMWKKEEVRSGELKLKIVSASSEKIEMSLEGAALLATNADIEKADRGFDAKLLGKVEFDRKKAAFTRFDIVALGDHWGEGRYTPGARSGRAPLGIAFELSPPTEPAVPPEGSREFWGYMHAE